MVTILPFQQKYKKGIDQMMAAIASEFAAPISNKASKSTSRPPDVYWVACVDQKVVGTIALIKINSDFCILKSMMVDKAFRGPQFQVAKSLMEKALDWCKNHQISEIYLGTMEQFVAAQRFYEKNGFVKILQKQLPKDFLNNPLDSVFYLKEI